jgi:hypothetical protein
MSPGTVTSIGLSAPSPSLTSSQSLVASSTPTTDFDVDLHYVKPGESFASIAKLHYADERYGPPLELFNRRAGFDGRIVQLPPTHWIKKQINGMNSGVTPVSRTFPAATSSTSPQASTVSGDQWTAANNANTYRFYELTTTRTFRELAKDAFDNEQDWQRIFDLNPSYSSDARLPAGARVRLPADARIGR